MGRFTAAGMGGGVPGYAAAYRFTIDDRCRKPANRERSPAVVTAATAPRVAEHERHPQVRLPIDRQIRRPGFAARHHRHDRRWRAPPNSSATHPRPGRLPQIPPADALTG